MLKTLNVNNKQFELWLWLKVYAFKFQVKLREEDLKGISLRNLPEYLKENGISLPKEEYVFISNGSDSDSEIQNTQGETSNTQSHAEQGETSNGETLGGSCARPYPGDLYMCGDSSNTSTLDSERGGRAHVSEVSVNIEREDSVSSNMSSLPRSEPMSSLPRTDPPSTNEDTDPPSTNQDTASTSSQEPNSIPTPQPLSSTSEGNTAKTDPETGDSNYSSVKLSGSTAHFGASPAQGAIIATRIQIRPTGSKNSISGCENPAYDSGSDTSSQGNPV